MTPEDVKAYVNRDWEAIEAMKTRSWLEMKQRLTVRELFAVLDNARADLKKLRPDWPSEADRREDYEHHLRLSRLLRRAGAPSNP